jgi:outer membrane protein assembly factor BamB
MPSRHRIAIAAATLLVLFGPLAASASANAGTTSSAPTQAVAYQISVSHDGYSADTTIKPPLKARWQVDFAGPVSYPLIADGKVFVTVADNGGNYGTNLYALSQATGKIVWSQPISGTYFWSNAAFDGGHLYVLNYDGLLRQFDAASGAPGWSVQLPGQYAFSSPPTAAGGIVYTGGAGSGGTVYAVSESDGTVLWTQPVENGDNSSPALSATDVYVSYACGLVYAFDRVTGQQRWFNNPGICEGGGGKTPVYHAGAVYARDAIVGNQILNADTGALVGTFQADPAPAFDGQTGLFLSAGTLQAVASNKTLWTFTGDGGLDTAPIAVGSTVYVGSSSGMLYGLCVTSGKVVWSVNVGAAIPAPDEQDVSQPLTGLGAGQGLLVVPAGNELAAYGS